MDAAQRLAQQAEPEWHRCKDVEAPCPVLGQPIGERGVEFRCAQVDLHQRWPEPGDGLQAVLARYGLDDPGMQYAMPGNDRAPCSLQMARDDRRVKRDDDLLDIYPAAGVDQLMKDHAALNRRQPEIPVREHVTPSSMWLDATMLGTAFG